MAAKNIRIVCLVVAICQRGNVKRFAMMSLAIPSFQVRRTIFLPDQKNVNWKRDEMSYLRWLYFLDYQELCSYFSLEFVVSSVQYRARGNKKLERLSKKPKLESKMPSIKKLY